MPAPLIFGCAGAALGAAEKAFFADADPLGFILFERNCRAPEQVAALIAELRQTVGRADAPVLVDQEGGRVVRLKPPHWRYPPAAAVFGRLYGRDPALALEAAGLNARLMAGELADLGISVNCLPVLDVAVAGAHDVIGDRAFAAEVEAVSALGAATADGLLAGGVLPVVKHLPGHGRATADSHRELPRVTAPLRDLEDLDFVPFKALSGLPAGMTAHVVYEALDDLYPATTSARVISGVIRGDMGFDGLLLSDSIEMEALSGGMGERTAAALAAGCDIVLHCSGDMKDMATVAGAAPAMSLECERRVEAMLARIRPPQPFDAARATVRLGEMLEF